MQAVFAAIAPVFLVAGAGYAVARRSPIDVRTLSTLNIYLLMPAIVFEKLVDSPVALAVMGQMLGAYLVTLAGMCGVMYTAARLRGLRGDAQGAFMMTTFTNLANFGLPVALFAYGEEGLAIAVVTMTLAMVFQNWLGIYFAHAARDNALRAAMRIFEYPFIYAFALAIVMQRMGWTLPPIPERAVGLLSDAAIGMQLLILGMQLAGAKLDRSPDVLLAAGLRLAAGPLMAAGAVWLTGLEGLPARVFVLHLSGPIALGMAVYAVQFRVRPGFVASAVSWSFVFSFFTVSLVLFVLKTFFPT